jgi:hypothetical protein
MMDRCNTHAKHPLYMYTSRVLSNRERESAVTVWDSNQRRGSVLTN